MKMNDKLVKAFAIAAALALLSDANCMIKTAPIDGAEYSRIQLLTEGHGAHDADIATLSGFLEENKSNWEELNILFSYLKESSVDLGGLKVMGLDFYKWVSLYDLTTTVVDPCDFFRCYINQPSNIPGTVDLWEGGYGNLMKRLSKDEVVLCTDAVDKLLETYTEGQTPDAPAHALDRVGNVKEFLNNCRRAYALAGKILK